MLNSGYDYESAIDRKFRQDPARAYLWRVELPDLSLPATAPVESSSLRIANANNPFRELSYDMREFDTRVTEISTPYFTFDTEKVIDGASFWYTVRTNDISTVSLTVDEDQFGTTFDYFSNWRNMIVNSDGLYNPPVFWKRDIKFWRLNLQMMDFQLFIYRNYFPNEISSKTNSYESGIVDYNISLTGDSMDSYSGDRKKLKDMYDQLIAQQISIGYDDVDKLDNAIKDGLFSIGTNLARNIVSRISR